VLNLPELLIEAIRQAAQLSTQLDHIGKLALRDHAF